MIAERCIFTARRGFALALLAALPCAFGYGETDIESAVSHFQSAVETKRSEFHQAVATETQKVVQAFNAQIMRAIEVDDLARAQEVSAKKKAWLKANACLDPKVNRAGESHLCTAGKKDGPNLLLLNGRPACFQGKGTVIYSNRGFGLVDYPEKLQEAAFVRAPLEGCKTVCLQGGKAYVIARTWVYNQAVSRATQKYLRDHGWEMADIEEFNLFYTNGAMRPARVYEKRLEAGELLELPMGMILGY